jgi:hypothetical protein
MHTHETAGKNVTARVCTQYASLIMLVPTVQNEHVPAP